MPAINDHEHEDAKLEIKELEVLAPPQKSPKHRPLLESKIKDDGSVHYSTETGVTALVMLYIEALIKAGGLSPVIEAMEDLYIAKYRPDVVIIYNERRIPCGVVEVKLPAPPVSQDKPIPSAPSGPSSSRTLRSSSKKIAQQQQPKESGPLASERFQGQIFNYLHFLRTFYKVENPFGIMTSYDEWRVCWLKPDNVTSREFEGTAIMPYNHPQLHYKIMTALVHMSRPNIRTSPEQVGSYFPYLNEVGLAWRQLTSKPTENDFPFSTSTGFMLLAPAGSGIEGKAWIACNTSWRLCILKTFTVKKDSGSIAQVMEMVKKELEIWHKVFGIGVVFSKTLAGAPAIVMPRLRLVHASRKTTLSLQTGDEDAVRVAVQKYAKFGKVARDIKWSHVGFLEKNPENGTAMQKMAILFDTRPEDCTDKVEAEEQMLDKLGL